MHLFIRNNPQPEKYKEPQDTPKEDEINKGQEKEQESEGAERKKGIYKTYWNNGNLKSEVVSNGVTSIVKNFNENGELTSTNLETPTTKLEKNNNGDVKLEVKDDKTLASDACKKIEDLKQPLKQFCKDNNLDFEFINNCDKKRMDYSIKD